MFVTAILLLCWSAVSWFSKPLDGDFLNIFIFSIDAAIPFFASFISFVIAIALWIRRSGGKTLQALSSFFENERKTALILIGILVLHVILQLPAIIMYHGAHDADSALYGLAGFEIADGNMRPMFNIGKHHMGSLVPHLLAGINLLFGDHAIYMRILLVVIYLGFLLLLFLFTRRHFDNATALLAVLLASIAPKELYKYLKHPENAVTLFLGMLSLLLISKIFEKESPKPRLYFYLGCVLGLGLWANYQFAYFVIASAIFFFIKDKLFFIKPAPWATVGGMLVGGVVILVDGFYYDWPFIKTVAIAGNQGSNFFSEFIRSVGKFFSHIPAFLGSAVSEEGDFLLGTDIMPGWFSIFISLVFVAAAITFVYVYRSAITGFFTKNRSNPGPGIVTVFGIVVFLIYTLSSYSHDLATTRYLMPFWIVIVLVLAGSIRWLRQYAAWAGSAIAALFAALFLFSSFFEINVINAREGWHRTFVAELRSRDIDAFYGPWLRTYWTTFVTDRQIIATASYPTVWNPIVRYNSLVDESDTKPAFLFIDVPTELTFRDNMLRRLDAAGISYKQMQTMMGILVYGFSQRVTPKQFFTLAEEGSYGATINGIVANQIPLEGSEERVNALAVEIENTGDIVWYANAQNGHVELLLRNSDGEEITRVPVANDVLPRQVWSVVTYLANNQVENNLQAEVVVNGFIIYSKESNGGISSGSNEIHPDDLLNVNLIERDGLFVDGWGRTVDTERGETRWSGANKSTIAFPLSEIRNLQLSIDFWPFQANNMPEGSQQMTITLNGEQLDQLEFEKFTQLELDLPQHLLKKGINRISFSYEKMEPTYSPLRTDGDPNNTNPRFRHRPRAVAFSMIVLTEK